MGACCSDQKVSHSLNHNAPEPRSFVETQEQEERIKKQSPTKAHAANAASQLQIHEEQREEQENKQEVNEIVFSKEIKTLQQALSHAQNLKDIIFKNGELLTNSIHQIEYILNLFNPFSILPDDIKSIKSDLIGLYGDMQMFRSFHLRFNLEQSFYENMHTLDTLYKFFRNLVEQNKQQENFNLLQQLINNNHQFNQLYQETKKLRHDFNQIHGTNFCTLPNYLFCTFFDKKGFGLWVELFMNEFEVSNAYFCQQYSNYTGIERSKVEGIIKLLDISNDQRVDIYQYIQFVEEYKEYLNEQGLLTNDKIDLFQNHIQSLNRQMSKVPKENPDGSYTLASGATYYGVLDQNQRKTGQGKLKDNDYEFEGTFENDLPTGKGKETRKKVVYEGEFKKGLYDGLGKLTFPNGRAYDGHFKEHMFHGKGELTNDDGVKYKGDWQNGCLIMGIVTYHDGSYYTGVLKGNFFKDGNGGLYNKEAMPQYEGIWENDQPKSQLKVYNIFDNHKIFYEGQMENYAITGKGVRFYQDGKYEGSLQRDRKEGSGELLYANGAKYVGLWVNDLQSKGRYIYDVKNPDFYYEGEWNNGVQEGQGEYKYPSGGVYVGQSKENKRHGYGTYYYSNKNKYVGYWENNNQQGDGQFFFSNDNTEPGDVYNGQFNQGKFQGFGNYLYKKSGKQYIGYWDNDQWNGIGVFKTKEGSILKCGEWKQDKFIKDIDVNNEEIQKLFTLEHKYKIQVDEQQQNHKVETQQQHLQQQNH